MKKKKNPFGRKEKALQIPKREGDVKAPAVNFQKESKGRY